MSQIATLLRLLERHAGADGKHGTILPGLTVLRVSAPLQPVEILYEPSLCLVVQGAKSVMFGSKTLHYDATKYLLVAADFPATAQVVSATPEEPYLGLRLDLDPLEVGEFVARLGPGKSSTERALGIGAIEPALLAAVIRLVELLESPHEAALFAPLVRQEITGRLLVGPQGPRLRQLVAGRSHGQRITQVMRWLKAHFADPIPVELLARKAGMSPSALYLHFKQVTGMSPLQYQKRMRLHEARRLMFAEALDAAEASFRVGYESPSHFSREYRRHFGRPPRSDVELLRRGALPARLGAGSRVRPGKGTAA